MSRCLSSGEINKLFRTANPAVEVILPDARQVFEPIQSLHMIIGDDGTTFSRITASDTMLAHRKGPWGAGARLHLTGAAHRGR